jgi:hypothetical protein
LLKGLSALGPDQFGVIMGEVLKPHTDSQPRGVFPENTMEQGLSNPNTDR